MPPNRRPRRPRRPRLLLLPQTTRVIDCALQPYRDRTAYGVSSRLHLVSEPRLE